MERTAAREFIRPSSTNRRRITSDVIKGKSSGFGRLVACEVGAKKITHDCVRRGRERERGVSKNDVKMPRRSRADCASTSAGFRSRPYICSGHNTSETRPEIIGFSSISEVSRLVISYYYYYYYYHRHLRHRHRHHVSADKTAPDCDESDAAYIYIAAVVMESSSRGRLVPPLRRLAITSVGRDTYAPRRPHRGRTTFSIPDRHLWMSSACCRLRRHGLLRSVADRWPVS